MVNENVSESVIFKDIIYLIQTNKLDEAKTKAKEVLNSLQYKDHFFILYLLGTICGKLGDVDESVIFFKRSIKLNKNFDPAYYNLGLIYFKNRMLEDAYLSFEKGLNINSSNYDCLFMLAKINEEQKKNYEAIEIYKKCIRLDSNKSDGYLAISNLYSSVNQNEEALNVLNDAYSKFKSNYKVLNNLGLILKKIGKLEQAIVTFYEGLKLKADEQEPLINIALCYLEKKNTKKL